MKAHIYLKILNILVKSAEVFSVISVIKYVVVPADDILYSNFSGSDLRILVTIS